MEIRPIFVFLLVLNVYHLSQTHGAEDDRIPFWNMAHMVNSFKEIGESLRSGANAVEIDVSFNSSGYPTEVYHGIPCDCGRHCHYRENFLAYIQFLGQLTDPINYGSYPNNLTLIMFDLKLNKLDELSKSAAGVHLARLLDEHIYRYGSRYINVILAINHVTDKSLIISFLDYVTKNRLYDIQKHVGFDVSMNDPINDVLEMWRSLGNRTLNIWQGDGITNCGSFLRDLKRLKEALAVRDNAGFYRKVYFWTVDLHSHIRIVLRLGIDSVITNHPDRVLEILQEDEFKDRYRLANLLDNPFHQIDMRYFTDQRRKIPNVSDAVSAVKDIKQTAHKYIQEFPESLVATADLLMGKFLGRFSGQ